MSFTPIRGTAGYRDVLHQLPTSAALDRRMAQTIARHAPPPKRRLSWTALAAAAAVVSGLALLPQFLQREDSVSGDVPVAAARGEGGHWEMSQIARQQGDAAVVRVRGTLASQPSERQYWLDVRIANDGSMRIVRVIPVQSTQEGTNP